MNSPPPRKRKPAQDAAATRALLLDTGLQLVRSKGLRGLVVRELAQASGVNLGSFVYHFGTRERFINELVERWYAPLYAALQQVAQAAHPSAYARLHATLRELVQLIAAHAGFAHHVFADAMEGEPAAHAFLLSLRERHPRLLLALVQQAQAEGSLPPVPPLQLLMYLMSAANGPLLVAAALLEKNWLPPIASPFLQAATTPQLALQRLEWALAGVRLKPDPHPTAAKDSHE